MSLDEEMKILPEGHYMAEITEHQYIEASRTLFFTLTLLDTKHAGVELFVYFNTAQASQDARVRAYAAYSKMAYAASGVIPSTNEAIKPILYGKRLKVHVGIVRKDGTEANLVDDYIALDGPLKEVG